MCNHIIKEGKFKGKKFCEVYKGFKKCCPKSTSTIMYTEEEVAKICTKLLFDFLTVQMKHPKDGWNARRWWNLNKKK